MLATWDTPSLVEGGLGGLAVSLDRDLVEREGCQLPVSSLVSPALTYQESELPARQPSSNRVKDTEVNQEPCPHAVVESLLEHQLEVQSPNQVLRGEGLPDQEPVTLVGPVMADERVQKAKELGMS